MSSYGITGNRYKGAHLELSKKAEQPKPSQAELEESSSSLFNRRPTSASKEVSVSDSFNRHQADEELEPSENYEALGASIRANRQKTDDYGGALKGFDESRVVRFNLPTKGDK